MNATYLRGELYYADLSKGVGSEQEGYRPVLIIQNDVGNKYSPTVIVAAVTSKVGVKPKLPTHYFLEAGTIGLTAPSIVLLEQLRTLDKRRLERYIGRVDSCHIREINRALAVSVGLMEEMPENLIMCLCPTCANNFYGTGSYYLRRINANNSEKDICTYCGQRRGFDYEVVQKPKDHDHLQENAEYAVNNVKYQVSASFQTPDDKIPTEDFADKLKRLILSEDVMNRSGKK